MIVTIAQFSLSQSLSSEYAKELFMQSANDYRKVKGLIRKYYILSEDGKSAGAVYLWESKVYAEKIHTAEWRNRLKEKYGSEPTLRFFDTAVVVDNNLGEIIED